MSIDGKAFGLAISVIRSALVEFDECQLEHRADDALAALERLEQEWNEGDKEPQERRSEIAKYRAHAEDAFEWTDENPLLRRKDLSAEQKAMAPPRLRYGFVRVTPEGLSVNPEDDYYGGTIAVDRAIVLALEILRVHGGHPHWRPDWHDVAVEKPPVGMGVLLWVPQLGVVRGWWDGEQLKAPSIHRAKQPSHWTRMPSGPA